MEFKGAYLQVKFGVVFKTHNSMMLSFSCSETRLLLLLGLLAVGTPSPMNLMGEDADADSKPGHDMLQNDAVKGSRFQKPITTSDPDPEEIRSTMVWLEFLRPKAELLVEYSFSEEETQSLRNRKPATFSPEIKTTTSISTTTEYGDGQEVEDGTTTDQPISKRNRHKIRYNIKNNFKKY
jgi:hypothetical protein